MEFESLFGLPAHPLLVHLPVILIPVAAVVAVAMAIRPVWFHRFGWWLVGLTGVGALGGILAAGSGEKLEHMLETLGEEESAWEHHAELGETARTVAIVFFLVVLALKAYQWWSSKKAAAPAVADPVTGVAPAARPATPAALGIITSVLLAVTGIASAVTIIQAGHDGAKVVWQEDMDNYNNGGGSSDEGGTDSTPVEEEEDDDDD